MSARGKETPFGDWMRVHPVSRGENKGGNTGEKKAPSGAFLVFAVWLWLMTL
jgi:hypothetical protein